MTVGMLSFRWSMCRAQVSKIAILVLATPLAGIFLFVNRGQLLIGDDEFINSMIPHHSIAIKNSRRASISDPRARELAAQDSAVGSSPPSMFSTTAAL